MHLLCRDPLCPGNTEPAGVAVEDACRFCGTPLTDDAGNVLAQLMPDGPPGDFGTFIDALRRAGSDVQLVELTSVRIGDKVLLSAMNEEGELVRAAVCEGEKADQVEALMRAAEHGG